VKHKCVTGLFATALTVFNVNLYAYEMLRHNPFEQPDMADVGRGAHGTTADTAGMELRGTVTDAQDPVANIDGEYYRLNHEISGYRVIRIESGSVTLSRGGTETVLTLHNNE